MGEKKMKNKEDLLQLIKNKKVLYVATKNDSYIRVSQEVELIKKESECYTIITSNKRNYIERVIEIYLKLLFLSTKKYDVVFVGFMAQMIIPVFFWKFRHCKIVTDFFISIYDTLVFDRKKIKQGTLVAHFLKWIDCLTIKKSKYLIADTKAHADFFSEEFDVQKENIFVYYLKADTSIYHPMIVKRKKKFLNKFIVLYFGSILPVQGVEVVMDAIRLLQSQKDIHFIIIGPIGKKINKVVSDAVTYIDWVDQNILAKNIAMADLCLGGHFSDTVNKANRTIPGKVYIYQAMGKKIILGASDANRELFCETDKDILFVEMGNPKKLAEVIQNVRDESRKGA